MSMCEHWDAGWCYAPEGPSNGCVGLEKCKINTFTEVTIKPTGYIPDGIDTGRLITDD